MLCAANGRRGECSLFTICAHVSTGIFFAARNSVKASENALELEKRRRDKYEELIAKYENWKTSSSQVKNRKCIT